MQAKRSLGKVAGIMKRAGPKEKEEEKKDALSQSDSPSIQGRRFWRWVACSIELKIRWLEMTHAEYKT